MDDKHCRTTGSGYLSDMKESSITPVLVGRCLSIDIWRLGGVVSQYIRNEFLYICDEDIKILFPEKNPIFKIHEIVCVRG
jgi:hypothetical protein